MKAYSPEEISKSDAETKCANGTTKYSRARYVSSFIANLVTIAVNHNRLTD